MTNFHQEATEIIDTMRYLSRHLSIPVEWTRQNKRLSPRAYDVLRLIEKACNEGKNIYAPEIAKELNLTRGRVQQLIQRLIDEKRITCGRKTRYGKPLTIHFTPEDYA